MMHIGKPFVGFETVPAIEASLATFSPDYARPTRRFPVRYLRYWFVRSILWNLHQQQKRPLRVLEAGIGYGKMLAFMAGPQIEPDRYALPPWIDCWDALSAQADPRTLARYSYSSFHQADLEKPFQLPGGDYDAVIVLHVLEHLRAPEAAMQRLLPALKDDGLLIGGSPTMPDMFAGLHERWLREKNAAKIDDLKTHKHLSVITPRRIRRFAKTGGFTVDLLSGAFLLRASRNPLEDYPWWLRVNLVWGSLFPALGGEIYFALRKIRVILAALLMGLTAEFGVSL